MELGDVGVKGSSGAVKGTVQSPQVERLWADVRIYALGLGSGLGLLRVQR